MRHLRSILYALVLGPAVWILTGVGVTRDLTARAQDAGTIETTTSALLLVLAGLGYAILLLSPLSPAGPALTGLGYFGVGVWARLAPDSYAGVWPGSVTRDGFDLSRPGYALSLLLAVPLLCTALSARRWDRYEPVELPLIGALGRARGKAAVAGTPVAEERTTVIPAADQTQVLPGRDETTTVLRTADADKTVPSVQPEEPTTLLPAADEQTTLLPAADEHTTVLPAADEKTTLLPAADEQTTLLPAADEKTALLPPADSDKTAESAGSDQPDETTTLLPAAESPSVGTSSDKPEMSEEEEALSEGAEEENASAPAETADLTAGQRTADLTADEAQPTTDLTADEAQPTADLTAEEAQPTTDLGQPTTDLGAGDGQRTADLGEKDQHDADRTQVIWLAGARSHDTDRSYEPGVGETTRVIGPGERTQIISRPQPDATAPASTQADRDRAAQEKARQAFRDRAAQERAREAFADRAAREAREHGDQTHTIKPPHPADDEETTAQAKTAGEGPEPQRAPSVLRLERPADEADEPTTVMVREPTTD